MQRTIILCLVTLAVAIDIAAQTQPAKTDLPPDYKENPAAKQIQGGVLNGKATSLPKPPYPAAARAVGASGAVSVQVLIDENGDVVSATAVSGHPLLAASSVEAARSAKFTPTTLSGQPVKVSGIITYNFVPAAAPEKLGDKGLLSEIPVTDRDNIWALGLFCAFIQTADVEAVRLIGDEQEFNAMLKDISSSVSAGTAEYKPTLEKLGSPDIGIRADAARELLRLARREFDGEQNWQIDVGEQVGFVLSELLRQKLLYVKTGVAYDANVLRTHLRRVSDLVATAPSGVSLESKGRFRRIAAFSEVTNLGTDGKFAEMIDAIAPLFAELEDK